MPVDKDSDKSRAAKASIVYKCIMVKCYIDSELDNKDIHIKIAYNTVDHYVPLCKGFKNKSKNNYVAKYTPSFKNVFKFMYKLMGKNYLKPEHTVRSITYQIQPISILKI